MYSSRSTTARQLGSVTIDNQAATAKASRTAAASTWAHAGLTGGPPIPAAMTCVMAVRERSFSSNRAVGETLSERSGVYSMGAGANTTMFALET